jgi:hypothetical protein
VTSYMFFCVCVSLGLCLCLCPVCVCVCLCLCLCLCVCVSCLCVCAERADGDHEVPKRPGGETFFCCCLSACTIHGVHMVCIVHLYICAGCVYARVYLRAICEIQMCTHIHTCIPTLPVYVSGHANHYEDPGCNGRRGRYARYARHGGYGDGRDGGNGGNGGCLGWRRHRFGLVPFRVLFV